MQWPVNFHSFTHWPWHSQLLKQKLVKWWGRNKYSKRDLCKHKSSKVTKLSITWWLAKAWVNRQVSTSSPSPSPHHPQHPSAAAGPSPEPGKMRFNLFCSHTLSHGDSNRKSVFGGWNASIKHTHERDIAFDIILPVMCMAVHSAWSNEFRLFFASYILRMPYVSEKGRH